MSTELLLPVCMTYAIPLWARKDQYFVCTCRVESTQFGPLDQQVDWDGPPRGCKIGESKKCRAKDQMQDSKEGDLLDAQS
jgi:hypothetical protein